jgi:hypothetical protein
MLGETRHDEDLDFKMKKENSTGKDDIIRWAEARTFMYPHLFLPTSPDHGNNSDISFSSSGCKSAAHHEPEVIDEVSEWTRWTCSRQFSLACRAVSREHFRSQGIT